MKPQWTFVRSRYLRCKIPNLICPRLPVLYQWHNFARLASFRSRFPVCMKAASAPQQQLAGDELSRRYLQVTSGSTLTRWPLKLAPVWRLTAARPADMFPGEGSAIMSHLNLTINMIEKLEDEDILGAVHKWRQHVLGSLTPLGAYVSLSSAFGMPLGALNWQRQPWTKKDHLWMIIENAQSTIHLPQKGSSWAWWDPLRPDFDGFSRIVGFFIIHHLFWWPLVPPRQLLSAF